jgi:hypothetical protein
MRCAIAVGLLSVVFFTFDGSDDPDVERHECVAFQLPVGLPVPCNVWYNADARRTSEYYAELQSNPPVGEAVMGCVRAIDYSGNASECVADSTSIAGRVHGNNERKQQEQP